MGATDEQQAEEGKVDEQRLTSCAAVERHSDVSISSMAVGIATTWAISTPWER